MRYILIFTLLLVSLPGQAQDKYWVRFSDKGDLSQYQPTAILSPRALANRARQNIALDETDYPVRTAYLQHLRMLGIDIVRSSRWLNAVSAPLSPEQITLVESLPFVQEIRGVAQSKGVSGTLDENCPDLLDTDTHQRQLSMVGLDAMHRASYTGKGVLVAVFDNGFRGVDTLAAFQHLFHEGRILATKDYVDNDDDVYETCIHCRHGTNVFSILAAKHPGQLMGSAPDASYLLLRTENDYSETHQEEDNWIAAAEFADSMGAQVFTTSLGYFSFDPGEGDYTPADLDGNTSLITVAADLAADKGILVFNSAGNYGSRGLVMPADGHGVIAVGAVDQCEEYASFSSMGPSADGRVKPDISAMGLGTFVSLPDGRIVRGNGTSFSCPVASGLMACMIQAAPNADRESLYLALIQSGHQYDNPDALMGYGIPNGPQALTFLQGPTVEDRIYANPFEGSSLLLYPNPAQDWVYLALRPDFPLTELEIEIIDAQGRLLSDSFRQMGDAEVPIAIQTPRQNGVYTIRISSPTFSYLEKLVVLR